MVKKKETSKKEEKGTKKEAPASSSFELNDELEKVHPFMREGFARFLLDKSVPDLETYKKYYKIYTGEDY